MKEGYFKLPIYFPIYPQKVNTYTLAEKTSINAPDTVLVIDENSNVVDILYRVEYRTHYQGWFEYKGKDNFKALIEWYDVVENNKVPRKIFLYDGIENSKMNFGGTVVKIHSQLGSSKELGISPIVREHDMIAECGDCGDKFSYQNAKKHILWECPECKSIKRIS